MRRPSEHEQGSALLFALLAMVFLTVIGLSLAVVSETEMLIGTNEQIARETAYTSEAGVAAAFGQVLVAHDLREKYFAIEARDGDEFRVLNDQSILGYSVDFTSVYPVSFVPAPYTTRNEGKEVPAYQGFFYTQVRSRRLAWPKPSGFPGTRASPDCQSESQRLESAPTTLEYFEQIQAEKEVTFGFWVAPIGAFGGEALAAGFFKPDHLGCAPQKADAAYIQ